MPVSEITEFAHRCAELVRQFNTPPDDDDKPRKPRDYVKRNGVYVPR